MNVENTNSAAALSLEINTGDALEKLNQLKAAYEGLLAEVSKVPTGKGAAAVGQDASASTAQITALTRAITQLGDHLAQLETQAHKGGAGVAHGLQEAESKAAQLKTALAGLGGSVSYSFKMDETSAARIKETAAKVGKEAGDALANGLTKSNWASSLKVDQNLEVGTKAAFQNVLRMAQEAEASASRIGSAYAKINFAPSLLDGSATDKAIAGLKKLEEAASNAKISSPTYLRQWGAAIDEDNRRDVEARKRHFAQLDELRQREYMAEQQAAHNLLNLQKQAREQLRVEYAAAEADKLARLAVASPAKTSSPTYLRQWDAAVREDQERAVQAARNSVNARAALYSDEYSAEQRAASNLVALKERTRVQLKAELEGELSDLRAAIAKEKALEKERADLAKWVAATPRQRASAAVAAAQVVYSNQGLNTADLAGLSASPQAAAAAKAAGSVEAAQKALQALGATAAASGGALKQNSEHLVHWSNIANEAHAAARGLSGALGGLWMTYGSMVPLVAGAAIAGSMASVVKVGKDLEYQLTFIKAITGETAISLAALGDVMKGAMFTPTEGAAGLRMLAQSGLSAKDALEALPAVMRLATVGETDMTNAALTAVSTMHTFGMEVADLSHIGDVFAKAAAISSTSTKEMMEAMKQASSVSNMYGVSLEHTAAALATMANRGIEGSAAGTALRNMLKELAAPSTQKSAEALKQFGIQIYNADGSSKTLLENLKQLKDVTDSMSKQSSTAFLQDIFTERGAKAVSILLSDFDKLKESLKDIEGASKGLGFMADAQMQIATSTDGLLKKLNSDVQLMFGQVFASVDGDVKNIIESFNKLATSEGVKSALKSIAESIVAITQALIDNAEIIKTAIELYVGYKAAALIGAAGISTLTAAMEMWSAASVAAISPMAASGAAMTTLGNLATAAGAAISRAFLPLAVGATALAGAYALWKVNTDALSDSQRENVKSAESLADTNRRLAEATEAGVKRLSQENDVLAEQIRLMKEGKSSVEALASAKRKVELNDSAMTVQKADALARQAEDRYNALSDEGDRNGQYSGVELKAALQEKTRLRAAADAAKAQHEALVEAQKKAIGEGDRNEALKAGISRQQTFEKFNETIKRIRTSADEAREALTKLDSIPADAREKRRAVLNKQIDTADKLSKAGITEVNTADFDKPEARARVANQQAYIDSLQLDYSKANKSALSDGYRAEVTRLRGEISRLEQEYNTAVQKNDAAFAAGETSNAERLRRNFEARKQTIEAQIELDRKLAAHSGSMPNKTRDDAQYTAEAAKRQEALRTAEEKLNKDLIKDRNDYYRTLASLERKYSGEAQTERERVAELWLDDDKNRSDVRVKLLEAEARKREAITRQSVEKEKAIRAGIDPAESEGYKRATADVAEAEAALKRISDMKERMFAQADAKDTFYQIDQSSKELAAQLKEIEAEMARDGGWVARIVGSRAIDGLISSKLPELKARVVELQDAFNKSVELDPKGVGDKNIKKQLDGAKKDVAQFTNYVPDVWKDVVKEVDKTFHDGFTKMMSKGKADWSSFTDSLKSKIKTTLFDFLYQEFARKFVLNVVANLAGMVGLNGMANGAMGAMGAAGNGMSMVSNAGSVYNMFSGSSSLASSFATSGVGQAIGLSTAGTSVPLASGSIVAAEAGIPTVYAANMGTTATVGGIAEGSLATAGVGGGLTSLGSAFMTAAPWVMGAIAIGSMLGLFGDSGPKQTRKLIHGAKDPSSYEDGKAYVDSVFGRYGYDDAGTKYADGRGMAKTLAAASLADTNIVQLLGLNSKQIEGVKGRLSTQNLSYMGEDMNDQDAIKRLITSHIKAAFEETRPALAQFVDALGPDNVDKILAFATAVRQGEDVLQGMGKSTEQINDQLVTAMGGAEAFTESIGKLSGMFAMSPLDQAIAAAKTGRSSITATLDGAGVEHSAISATTADMKKFAASLDLTTEAGRAGLKTLAEVGPKIKGYQDQLLALAGTTRDNLTKSYVDALKSSPDAASAGKAVADVIVTGLQDSMLTSYAGQITDIMVSGIITPAIDGLLQGQAISEALSQASISAAIKKAEATAAAFAAIWSDPSFQTAMATIKTSVAGVGATGYIQHSTYIAPVESQAAQQSAANDAAQAAKDAADLIAGVTREIAALGVSPLQQKISDINQQYQAQVIKLGELKSATSDNIALLDKWKNAMISMAKWDDALGSVNKLFAGVQSLTAFSNTVDGNIADLRIASGSLDKKSWLDGRIASTKGEVGKLYSDGGSVDEMLAKAEELRSLVMERYQLELDNTKQLMDSARQVGDFLAQLRLSDKSPLTMGEKLAEAGKQFNDVLLTLESGSEADKALARQKLTGSADAYLSLAKTYDPSKYAQVYSEVEKALAPYALTGDIYHQQLAVQQATQISVAGGLEELKNIKGATEYVKQIEVTKLNTAMSELIGLKTALGGLGVDVTGAIKDLPTALRVLIDGRAEIGTSQTRMGGTLAGQVFSNSDIKGWAAIQVAQGDSGLRTIYDSAKVAGMTLANVDTLLGLTSGTAAAWAKANNLPAFDVGTNYVPHDMVAQIHQGERIVPAADNRRMMEILDASSGDGDGRMVAMLEKVLVELQQTRAENARLSAMLADSHSRSTEEAADKMAAAVATRRRTDRVQEIV